MAQNAQLAEEMSKNEISYSKCQTNTGFRNKLYLFSMKYISNFP